MKKQRFKNYKDYKIQQKANVMKYNKKSNIMNYDKKANILI